MKQDRGLQEKAAELYRKDKSNKKRFAGTLLILIGVVLGVVSKATGGNPFQDFTSGILMGMSVGVLLVGVLMMLLPYLKNRN